MEPMVLGSPVGSPITSPSVLTSKIGMMLSPQSSNNFYPWYLMGESPSNLNLRYGTSNVSPGKKQRQHPSSNPISPHSPNIADNVFSKRMGGEKQVGPPNLKLRSDFSQSPIKNYQFMSFVEQQKIVGTPTSSNGQNLNNSISSYQVDQSFTPSFTSVKELSNVKHEESCGDSSNIYDLENSWVTIYGFPVASASYILTQFSQFGPIVEHKLPGLGNWMYIKYQTKLQARKALTRNGKILNKNIMIGVMPCSDPNINESDVDRLMNTSSFGVSLSPRNTPLKSESTPKSQMRPLTQAYQAARSEIEVTPTSNTPKKNEGVVSRAIQHLLGI